MASRAVGLLVRRGDELCFVPGTIAEKVVRRPVVTRVPAVHLGITLVDGRVVAVVEVGEPVERGGNLVLCALEGETVALSGLDVVDSGAFDEADGGVLVGGERVPPFDVAHEIRTVVTRPPRGLE